jgi:hypothetical protein
LENWLATVFRLFSAHQAQKTGWRHFSAFFSPPGAQTPALQSIDGKVKLCVLGTSNMVDF